MPQSKKPRKRHNPHKVYPRSALMVSEEFKEKMQTIFTDVEISLHEHLHRGDATDEDIASLRDVVNLLTVGLVTRDWLDVPADDPALAALVQMQMKFFEFQERFIKTGSRVCRGDELRAFNEGLPIAFDFIKDSIDLYPHRFLKEWMVMRQQVDGAPPGQVVVAHKKIREAMRR